jgi:putative protease
VGEIILEIGVVGHADLQAAAEKHAATRGRDAIRFALPAIMRSWDRGLVRESVDALWGAGWRRWQVANLWALALLPAEARELVTADWPLYTMNAAAGRAWREAGLAGVTLSPEDGLENLGEVGRRAPDAVVVVYQDTPLFVSETCVRLAGAGSCPGVGRCDFDEEPMRSSRGDRVRAINRRCRTWVIGESPLCWATELPALRAAGARAFRVDFLLRRYAPAEARDLWRRLRAGHSVPGTRLGNLHRGLQ